MRLKLDLSVMEHYERHCPLKPQAAVSLNILKDGPISWPDKLNNIQAYIEDLDYHSIRIKFLKGDTLFNPSSKLGYKIPIKRPKSKNEVWKANIPHTHLATEKSDQNWMIQYAFWRIIHEMSLMKSVNRKLKDEIAKVKW
ncbi:uncharacterized protein LOC21390053 [Morus notabilis]|uniref:uncharacterized protein LOC21390053 n=1 Tax=Morus notabilis TaxID=981085 RepID=UPI000CED5E55|nr:uncharacterized protein LOC21390053 [Morus notabilis]